MAKRRRFTAKFKAEVVLEALGGESSQAELCRRHNLSENQVSTWKRQLLENVETFFESADKQSSESAERIVELEQLVFKLSSESSSFRHRNSPFKWIVIVAQSYIREWSKFPVAVHGFILLLPFILIGWNLYTYYTAQKTLDMSDKHIGEYYLKQNYQHTENREPLNKFKTLNLISQIIFAVSLFCLACLLLFTYYGGQQMADKKTTHTTDIKRSDTHTTDVQRRNEINESWGVPPETPTVPSDMLPPTSQDPKGDNNPPPPAPEDHKPDNPPEQGEGRRNPK